jgi:hypothetical protein
MKKLVLKYAMMAVCYFSSMTLANSVRASDFAEQNTHLSRVQVMNAESQIQKAQIESLTRALEDAQMRLNMALSENEFLNRELGAINAIKENVRSVEALYLKEHQRANQAISELSIVKMHTAPYLEMENADLRQQASRDAKTIADQAATIQKLRLRLSLRRL